MFRNKLFVILGLFAILVIGLIVGLATSVGTGEANRCHNGNSPKCHTTTTHTTTTTPTTTTSPGQTGGYTHVVWVVMENHSYSQIIGSSSAPYITSLSNTYGNATQMYAESHPSLPNYIAMTSGGTQGITDDSGPSSHLLSVNSIFKELGTNSRSLEESMPSNCYKGNTTTYVNRHNPELYYTNLNGACSTNDVPLGTTPNISAKFTFITPNLCHDMHSNSCSGSSNVILQGDNWLKSFIPKLTATTQYTSGSTVIFLVWDEDNGGSGNHIPTIVISPTSKGIVSSTRFTHYSMLRTTEEILGIPLIGSASSAASMRSVFKLG